MLRLLRGAEQVHVLEIRSPHSQPCEAGIEQYLGTARRRVFAKSVHLDAASIGDMLAGEAASCGANLLVMGGYGHSHLRETFVGGVTSDVLERARMPVFLAH